MARGDIVNVIPGHTPDDYHCDCSFCRKVIGELRPADGSYYSRLERRQYYDPREGQSNSGMAHIAKTPLHIARWAVQAYTNPGDWVLDPTIGAGTTAVESITQGRSAAGMELEFTPILKENVARALSRAPDGVTAHVAEGDARNISDILADIPAPTLVINNPPYSGDVSMPSPGPRGRGKEFRDEEITYQYNTDLPNLAFLKEGPEYWRTMGYDAEQEAVPPPPGLLPTAGRARPGLRGDGFLEALPDDSLHEHLQEAPRRRGHQPRILPDHQRLPQAEVGLGGLAIRRIS
jgi:hypothetical protein